MSLATVCDQTTPLICAVGRPSALTVAGVAGLFGSFGIESAAAGTADMATPTVVTNAIAHVRATRRRKLMRADTARKELFEPTAQSPEFPRRPVDRISPKWPVGRTFPKENLRAAERGPAHKS